MKYDNDAMKQKHLSNNNHFTSSIELVFLELALKSFSVFHGINT